MGDEPKGREKAIFEALPGGDELSIARTAILRLFHAGERVQWVLDDLEDVIKYFIADPANAIFDRVISDAALTAETRLSSLSHQFRVGAATLDALRESWLADRAKDN